MNVSVIILAAGQGSRMKSSKPKVLHEIAGIPMLHHILKTIERLSPQQIIIVCGYKHIELQNACKNYQNIEWVYQKKQLGTGDAVKCAYTALKPSSTSKVLLLYGDVPMIQYATLKSLLDETPSNALGIISTIMQEPNDLGKIIRNDQGYIQEIVEVKDATLTQLNIKEVNSGLYVLPYKYLSTWLKKLRPNNKRNELYITDVIKIAAYTGVPVLSHTVEDYLEVLGINSQRQLAKIERAYQVRVADELMQKGVKLFDPNRIDIRGNITVGYDVSIDINTIFYGDIVLKDNVMIGAHVIIKNSIIGAGSIINPHCVIENTIIGKHCTIGPFARIRPYSKIAANSKIGNFVEIKKSVIDEYSKINHLSYIGDSNIGKYVNIGAGVITCNYDGVQKHKTIIEDNVFVGSNCELIAPVKIGEGATIGAGTTLNKNAPSRTLTFSKKILTNLISWKRPIKQKKED